MAAKPHTTQDQAQGQTELDFDKLYEQMQSLQEQIKEQSAKKINKIKDDLKTISQVTGKDWYELLGLERVTVNQSATPNRINSRSGRPTNPGRVSKNPPKYKNPANHSETWSGSGRQPVWYKDYVASGKNVADIEMTDEELSAWKAANTPINSEVYDRNANDAGRAEDGKNVAT